MKDRHVINSICVKLCFISVFFTYILVLSSCGIPDYPYLFPPDALGDPEVGFEHDDRNDPDVFEGYEIYYKFYKNKNPDDDGIAESEMNIYFNTSSSFYSISNNTSSTAYNQGFRKLVLNINNTTAIPQLSIAGSEKDGDFKAELEEDGVNEVIELTLSNYLSSDEEYYCYRTVDDADGGYESFLPFDSATYSVDDSDVITNELDFALDTFFVAFFAVTFGYDDDGVAIFSNFSSDGMVYIGSFELSN